MIQIETIKWMPYPEYKPELGKTYRVQIYQETALPKYRNIQIDASYFEYCLSLDWYEYRYIDSINDTRPYRLMNVIAFAELPNGYNPDAKTFNFMTALELMKQGKRCVCIATSSEHWYSNKFGITPTIMECCAGFEIVSNFDLMQIESDWELADEQ